MRVKYVFRVFFKEKMRGILGGEYGHNIMQRCFGLFFFIITFYNLTYI